MARLNWRRRAELKARLAARDENPSSQPTRGFVRSSTGAAKRHNADQVIPEVARAYAPNPIDEARLIEGAGVRGRVSRGKLVPPAKRKPWSRD